MPTVDFRFDFLRHPAPLVLTVSLLLQIGLFHGLSRTEHVPAIAPLNTLPANIGSWRTAREGVVDQEVQDILRADDLLTRVYVETDTASPASLFVAFFKSQRTGKAPHSPKNCLPGAGWSPLDSGFTTIPIPGRAAPIQVNRYIVSRGDERSVVFYWYQSRSRIIASEFEAKAYLIADSIRYNRSDTALVRVVVPFRSGADEAAVEIGIRFIQALFGPLEQHLPS